MSSIDEVPLQAPTRRHAPCRSARASWVHEAGFTGITGRFAYFFLSGTTLSATRFPPVVEPTRHSASS
jgi:hypothetical protein